MITEDLQKTVDRCRDELAKPVTWSHSTRYITTEEVVISRADLTALVDAAAWRVGYLEGKGDR